jgi:hypothetical protein
MLLGQSLVALGASDDEDAGPGPAATKGTRSLNYLHDDDDDDDDDLDGNLTAAHAGKSLRGGLGELDASTTWNLGAVLPFFPLSFYFAGNLCLPLRRSRQRG